MLTDLIEVHFIKLPKFRALQEKNFKENALQRWLAFLEKDITKNMLEELIEMEPAIKMAEEKLHYLSSAPHIIELYKAREIARALMDTLDDEMIAIKTGLGIEQVKALRSEYEK